MGPKYFIFVRTCSPNFRKQFWTPTFNGYRIRIFDSLDHIAWLSRYLSWFVEHREIEIGKSPKMAWWGDRLKKIIGFPCVNDYKDIEKSFLSLAGMAIKKNPEWSLSHFYELPSRLFFYFFFVIPFLGSNCNTTTRRLLLLFPKTSCWWLSAVAGVRHASHPVDYSLSPTIFLHTIYPTLRVSQNPDPLQ